MGEKEGQPREMTGRHLDTSAGWDSGRRSIPPEAKWWDVSRSQASSRVLVVLVRRCSDPNSFLLSLGRGGGRCCEKSPTYSMRPGGTPRTPWLAQNRKRNFKKAEDIRTLLGSSRVRHIIKRPVSTSVFFSTAIPIFCCLTGSGLSYVSPSDVCWICTASHCIVWVAIECEHGSLELETADKDPHCGAPGKYMW